MVDDAMIARSVVTEGGGGGLVTLCRKLGGCGSVFNGTGTGFFACACACPLRIVRLVLVVSGCMLMLHGARDERRPWLMFLDLDLDLDADVELRTRTRTVACTPCC